MKLGYFVQMLSVLVLLAGFADASVIVYSDLTDTPSLTIDGQTITGNGGKVSNFMVSGEMISFTFALPADAEIGNGQGGFFFTNLLECLGCAESDEAPSTSDRLELTLTAGEQHYFVEFGSDPNLPLQEGTDISTIPGQGIPNPYFENGTPQLVATIDEVDTGQVLDTLFIQSDVPEPRSGLLVGVTLSLLGLTTRSRPASL